MLKLNLQEYLIKNGRSPFNEWLEGLRDLQARARVETRLDRASLGNLGDYASIGSGVFELRIFHGPGYRVYYSLEGETVMLLLFGGMKGTQQRDIRVAKAYLADYRKQQSGKQ
jgi:putative addiction module killer protein